MLQPLMHFLNGTRIVLASASPRRKSILENIGLKIEVLPSQFEENIPREKFPIISEYAIATAKGKAYDVWNKIKSDGSTEPELVIGADTVVSLDGSDMFGKPENEKSAIEMLRKLSGRTHLVYTGVVLLWKSKETGSDIIEDTFYEMTKVHMAPLSEQVILDYIKTGEPFGKAGSYGIQAVGSSLVEGVEGDFFNVVGFPIHQFCKRVSHRYRERQGESGAT